MLGRDHILITSLTIAPFLIPILFGATDDLVLAMVFFLSVILGSLTPDADCGGKATLFYKFPVVDSAMKKFVIKPVVFVFQRFVNKRYHLEYEVKEEHRGIMHAPVGVIISSTLLSLGVLIVMIIVRNLNLLIFFAIFLGLLVGQTLHLLEDSCTVSGINWKFPFGTKELKGKIYTFQKEEGKKDIRPRVFQILLASISIILVIAYNYKIITFSLWLLYLLITVLVIVVWLIIIALSRTEWKFWYQDVEKLKKIKKQFRSITRANTKTYSNLFYEPRTHNRRKKTKRKTKTNNFDFLKI